MKPATLLTTILLAAPAISQAATIQFNLIGTAGPGLLFGNEPAVGSGGTGGEINAGITFDDVAKTLSIDVAWGSASGFTNLTGAATNAHIHGPTTNNNGNNGVGDWRQTAGVLIGLTSAPFTYNNSATAGGIVGTSAPLNAANEAALFAGKLYLNVHTGANGGGEMRGFLTPVPEPGTAVFGLAALGGLVLRRRRA
jgi:MYXO-CTERM domain-containing protein